MGVSRSMDEFRAKVGRYAQTVTQRQVEALERSADFVGRNLANASRDAAGADRRLSRAGPAAGPGQRKGYFLGYIREQKDPLIVEFRKSGPWQFVDNSAGGGPTAPHTIGPRPDANKRPIPPSRRTAPSGRHAPALKFRSGGFSKSPVEHPGSARFPFWNRALYTGRSTVIELHRRAFAAAGREVFR